MYIILVYDVAKKRDAKILKIARKYLHSVQRSVFDGTLTAAHLSALKRELSRAINPAEDSVKIFRFGYAHGFAIDELGCDAIDNTLII